MIKSQTTAIQALMLEQLIVQDTNNIVSDMGGEKVILSINNGKYYNLGLMGSQIWVLIKEPVTITNVIDALLQEFEVAREVCEEQVLSFLSHLLEERLIYIKE
ncbi:metallophosphoesterase [Paenibacillus sp. FSL A5-0031]|uniref:lasso peptide biosynthesis PqqD family chaperone n=1 Tax=Paenibacillus sp. FSL A5-0031 TaxID=1920420 RepID=UPI00096F0757|nr:lasso peptide biosynthesis PqqD family chaperone [Paenibacillus sp. FSL A5-0031]OME83939.1 metallophosphoesterase [Paenibacillus sp. FSL A5-0031]